MRVVLVNMPCSSIRPPLGLGLLKRHLELRGHEGSVLNANIYFARAVGPRFYHFISEVAPVEALLGEWLFAAHVSEEVNSKAYLDLLASTYASEVSQDAQRSLVRARDEVDSFLALCTAELLDRDPDLVGFSTSFTQNMASLALARRIKELRPETTIAFGGANCEDVMGVALHRAYPFVDLVFCGEADISFPRAVDALTAGAPLDGIRGVVRRDSRGVTTYDSLVPERMRDLDELPFPDYDDFFEQYRTLPPGSRVSGVPMETSRGCWWGEKHHCTFCGLNGTAMTYRSKSPDRALAELDHLQARYRVRDIQMVDNILDMAYLRSFLPALAERDVKPKLFYETKANLTREQLALFRAAGISAIQPGVESLDSGVLRLMRKGTTGMRNLELLKACRELGLWPHWNILYGFPGEEPEAYARMADLVDAISHLDAPNVCSRLRLDRFSPLYLTADESGLVDVRPAPAYRILYDVDGATLHDLAYYFEFDYADGRAPQSYVAALEAAVQRWQRGSGDLTYRDDDEVLRLIDTRRGRHEVALTGAARELYLHCLTSRPLDRLAGGAADAGLSRTDVDVLLNDWREHGLVAVLDGRVLGLAVDSAAAERWRAYRKPSWSRVREASVGGNEGARMPRRRLLAHD